MDPPFPDTAIIPVDTRLAADAALVREALLIREHSAYTLDDVRRYASARQAAARLGISPLPPLVAVDGAILIP